MYFSYRPDIVFTTYGGLTDHVVECRMKVWRQDDVIDLEKC